MAKNQEYLLSFSYKKVIKIQKKFDLEMSDYDGLLRICHVKRKKGENFGFTIQYNSKRNGKVSFRISKKSSKNSRRFFRRVQTSVQNFTVQNLVR